MVLYQRKYRVSSTRLQGWDYTQAGWYYVTLCTHHRRCHFGAITDGQMLLTACGTIVIEEWQRTAIVRPNIALDAWVLMPNHLHGILIIQDTPGAQPEPELDPIAETAAPASTLKPGSIGAIIGQIKSICKKRIRAQGVAQFDWQPRFHDHIIRDDRSLANIRQYIENNPAQWALDDLNPDYHS